MDLLYYKMCLTFLYSSWLDWWPLYWSQRIFRYVRVIRKWKRRAPAWNSSHSDRECDFLHLRNPTFYLLLLFFFKSSFLSLEDTMECHFHSYLYLYFLKMIIINHFFSFPSYILKLVFFFLSFLFLSSSLFFFFLKRASFEWEIHLDYFILAVYSLSLLCRGSKWRPAWLV